MYNGTGTPTISSSSFLTNSVTTDAGRGGGLYNESADLTIEGLTFQGTQWLGYFHSPTNWAAGFGGGLYNGSGTLVIRGNTFQGNWASGYHRGHPIQTIPMFSPGLAVRAGASTISRAASPLTVIPSRATPSHPLAAASPTIVPHSGTTLILTAAASTANPAIWRFGTTSSRAITAVMAVVMAVAAPLAASPVH